MSAMLCKSVTRQAPAKVNLALHVTGKREDGYHLLDMLVVFTGFGDVIHVVPSEQDSFTVSGPFAAPELINDNNLVLRARNALRKIAPDHCPAVAIELQKNLPLASGIGGGSSDAAATLHALISHWELSLEQAALEHLALSLGADVPMCLYAQYSNAPLHVRGIGEIIQPLATFPPLAMLLVNDGSAIATPQIFKTMEKRDNPPLPPLPAFKTVQDITAYLHHTRNDLFPAASLIAPSLISTIAELETLGANFVRMSGSGATCFAIFDHIDQAESACSILRQRHPDWFIAATQTI